MTKEESESFLKEIEPRLFFGPYGPKTFMAPGQYDLWLFEQMGKTPEELLKIKSDIVEELKAFGWSSARIDFYMGDDNPPATFQ